VPSELTSAEIEYVLLCDGAASLLRSRFELIPSPMKRVPLGKTFRPQQEFPGFSGPNTDLGAVVFLPTCG
jgi:hypothetical protein